MQMSKRLAAMLTSAAMVTTMGLVATGGTASAASNPYDYTVCGSGYRLVSDGVIDVRTPGGTRYAQMYVTWNSSSKLNCVVVIKRRYVGTRTEMIATVQADRSEGSVDRGNFKYYAGPVYDYAPSTCIGAMARMWSPSHNTRADAYEHGWCS